MCTLIYLFISPYRTRIWDLDLPLKYYAHVDKTDELRLLAADIIR